MDALNVAPTLLGRILLALNFSSGVIIDRVPVLSQPFVATEFGVVIGPTGLGLLALST